MKQLLFCLILIAMSASVYAQETLSITQCYELARNNYPLIKQYALIDKTEQYNLSNAGKGWLPQLAVSAKVSYQSDVTKLPFDTDKIAAILPGFDIPTLNKDQYQVVAEINQTLWDGGIIHSRRELVKAQAIADREQLESDLYTLNQRVNQLYFGRLLQDELLKQNAILQKEFQVNIDRTKAMMDNGIANQSDLESLEVELLNTRQKEIELKAGREAYNLMLGTLIGKPITETMRLATPPSLPGTLLKGEINRPELRALEAQSNLLDVQNKQINAGVMPRIGLFVQGGYGRPGLNMLENSFEPFYVAGIRFSWNIGRFYTLKNDRKRIETGKNSINLQREIFLFNKHLELMQHNTDIKKIQDLLKTDHDIANLRTNIKKSAEVKLENGVISVTDLIREINAEDIAKQTVSTRSIELIYSIYNYIYTTNTK